MQELQERRWAKNTNWTRVRRIMLGDVDTVESVGIITAQNPNTQQIARGRNLALNRQLIAALEEKNCKGSPCGQHEVGGKFGHPEDSFLVPNITSTDLIELGNRFHQSSVIWGHKRMTRQGTPYFDWSYIECDGKGGGNITQTRSVSVANEDVQSREDFYSAVGDKKFIIPFFDDPYSNYEPGEKMGSIVQRPTIPINQPEKPHFEPDAIPLFGDEPPLRKAENFRLWLANRKLLAEKAYDH